MIKKIFLFVLLSIGFSVIAQKKSKEFRFKKFIIKKDTLQIDSLSINSYKFKVFTSKGELISPNQYQVNFPKAQLIINKEKYSEITVEYYRFPDFITKTYTPFDERLIVPNTKDIGKLYSLTTNKKASETNFFNGLKTQGFVARGITTGNNQNAVTNSSLDLTIEGKLSDKVGIRANIFDTNIPLQQNGYSQNITEFDRVFIELYSKNWRVKAGDISMQNKHSYFLSFNKQVAGLQVEANLNKNTKVAASGAVVRGRFTSFNFTGVENNQGPYKILGSNNESAIVIISGSDNVFVNGIQLERGETKDYVIDYNLAEIRFNTTYPITNDMRIAVEFQYSDRNYTRFVTYENAVYSSNKFSLAGYFYSENDAKNQPLQQSLTNEQKQILANAGNDASKMIAPSAFRDEFSVNRIQYKKTTFGSAEAFEYSTNENDELYSVTFTNVGLNKGSYIIDKTIAIGTIFKYVGSNLGSYEPIVRLIAPSKFQAMVVNSAYNPSEKTKISTEISVSNNDVNLFSNNNSNNKGLATFFNWKQDILGKKWKLKSDVFLEYKDANFYTEQGHESIEFFRDWNVVAEVGRKSWFGSELILENDKKGFISYGFRSLSYKNNFKGTKHLVGSKLQLKNTILNVNGNFLKNETNVNKASFFRLTSNLEQHFKKSWIGASINLETNDRKEKNSNNLLNISHRFKEYETYVGIGDSTKLFTKIGFNFRINDSVKANQFTEINNRKTFFVNSKIVQNKRTNLTVYANYRVTKNHFKENEKSLNSRVIYKQRFFNNFLVLGTIYETSSGNIARQDYVYVKAEPGQGYYTWIDYNNDTIQQFNEFEVAQFQDQADYLRVALPNLTYLPTQRAKVRQSITLNASQWNNKFGVKKALSYFYNQTYLLVDNEQQRVGNSFNFNPFDLDETKLLGLTFNLRNSLYFNRNQQYYSLIYTYGKSRNKNQFSVGNQENNTFIHQLEIQHKLSQFWLLDIKSSVSENKLETQNFVSRNYLIDTKEIQPKFTFLYNKDHRFSIFYQFKKMENELTEFQQLQQQKIGMEYFFINKKQNQITANVNVFLNNFTGNANSPVGYQMLEGLQSGRNYTWSLLLNQKLNTYLNLNLSYLGRKSETSKTIHTGTVQLKAIF